MSQINENAKLKLVSMRLSANPDATVIDAEDGINGKLNQTSDGRAYYIATFQDPSNPFSTERYRVISQQTNSAGDSIWKAGNPSLIKQFIGKLIPGDIVTKDVPAYYVGENEVTSYSCVVLKGENIETVFRQQGHELTDNDSEYDALLDEMEDEATEEATIESNATETV